MKARQHLSAARAAQFFRPQQGPIRPGMPNPSLNAVAALMHHRLRAMQQDALKKNSGSNLLSAPAPGPESATPANALEEAIDLLLLEEADDAADEVEKRETFMEYYPSKLLYGSAHPDPVVETATLASVEPPNVTYTLAAHKELVDERRLSSLQIEAVVYACQRHEQILPSGARGGFFIGDGAGVGKGRTIAGLMLENWKIGRKRHLWISVGSDLKVDAERDLRDVGATGPNKIPLHALNKLPYKKIAGREVDVQEGIIFLTYASLIAKNDKKSNKTRFQLLTEWCGPDFDGLIVFDESHKAKNLVPEAGGKPTQVGLKVRELQTVLKHARVVYCSATGASEPRNMGYMVRLGLWGVGHSAFPDFPKFLDAIQGKGGGQTATNNTMAALELVAMDMKSQGVYVCRTLSFASAEFSPVEAPLEDPVAKQYVAAAEMWNRVFREFLFAEDKASAAMDIFESNQGTNCGDTKGGDSATESAATKGPSATTSRGTTAKRGGGLGTGVSMTWRAFWAAHQRFFRHMCMAAKVPCVVKLAKEAIEAGKCVVIGLQSTGEAHTADVVGKIPKGEDFVLDDFVSGPKELLSRLVEQYYPLPPDPNKTEATTEDEGDDEDFDDARINEEAAKGGFIVREASTRSKGNGPGGRGYKEYATDGELVLGYVFTSSA